MEAGGWQVIFLMGFDQNSNSLCFRIPVDAGLRREQGEFSFMLVRVEEKKRETVSG